MTHAEIGSIHRACKHASMSFKANQSVELYVVLMPRHMQVCIVVGLPWIVCHGINICICTPYTCLYISVDGRDNV